MAYDEKDIEEISNGNGSQIFGDERLDDEFDEEVLGKHKIMYRIGDFEQPLELIYALIKDSKIDLDDFFISDITNQYVEIVANTPEDELDYEYAGQFITMAAELVYLKSLLVLPPEDDEELDEDDPAYERQLFINKLKEYALLKEQSEKLREVETINRFWREPVYSEKDYRVALVNFSLTKLVAAFAGVLANAERRGQEVIPKKVVRERFSVHDQMQNILGLMLDRRQVNFTELFEEDFDKSAIITTFLAVLELVKYGRITVTQQETFGEISLCIAEGVEDAPIIFEEGDDGKY